MKSNPYQPPEAQAAVVNDSHGTISSSAIASNPLYWLLGIAALTLLLAWIDALQERVPGFVFTMLVTFGAIIAQLPGLACGELYRRSSSRNSTAFLIPAFFVAVISLLIYFMYVLAGQVQTIDNAGQMHIILIPILLAMLAFVAYVITGVVIGILHLLHRNAG